MKRVYLDHNATTPIHPEVKAAMIAAMEVFGNASSHHSFGREAHELIENARKTVADALGAQPEEIIFTSCGSESNNLVIKGVTCGNSVCKIGCERSEVIISAIEHPSVLNTAKCLQGEGKIVHLCPVNENGVVKLDVLESLISDKTALVSIMYANNETGAIQPIEEIANMISGRNIIFHTDAVQAFGKIPINVKKLNLDFLSLSGHKIYGPKGVGVLYKKKLRKVCPLIHGGHHEFNLRAGTENTVHIAGLGKAVELCIADMDSEWQRLGELRNWFEAEVVHRIPDSIVNGADADRMAHTSNISFRYIEGESILYDLDFDGIAVSTGSACSSGSLEPSHVLLAMGMDHGRAHSSIRFSLGRSTTKEDLVCTLGALERTVTRLRNMSPLWKDRIKKA
ncbi:MAG: cysteine desulfurase [Acidobacteria bacterium]|nr:cysteine desulfurase [Acidobacteriota bacterium]